MRSALVLTISPSWRALHVCKASFASFFDWYRLQDNSYEYEKLEREHAVFESQISSIREWLLNEDQIALQVERFKLIAPDLSADEQHSFVERRRLELANSLKMEMQGVYGKVIYREPASWSSSLWLNVGEKNNKELGRKIVTKNSPVVKGRSVLGVIEHVGWRQSRVRLLTDPHLNLSVRAIRGSEQNRFIEEQIEGLYSSIEFREDLFSSEKDHKAFCRVLLQMKHSLKNKTESSYLAKGEIQGSNQPLWRCRNLMLHGMGFNYDFADAEGLNRELRTGQIFGGDVNTAIPLLKLGDLLLTTGMDGLFPAGYRVGVISKIHPLREGGSAYGIEAVPAILTINDIADAWVLPPINSIE